jgi:hypothetical protein
MVEHHDLIIDPKLTSDVSGFSTPRDTDKTEYSLDPNIISLHLVRHFKEGPGQW